MIGLIKERTQKFLYCMYVFHTSVFSTIFSLSSMPREKNYIKHNSILLEKLHTNVRYFVVFH